MTARSRMTQRAYVERYSPGADDDSGNPTPGSWAPLGAERIPVWLYGSVEREAVTPDAEAVIADLRAMVPLAADITESDRLGGAEAAIVDRRGTVIEPGPLDVDAVLRKRTHLQLTLSRVTA